MRIRSALSQDVRDAEAAKNFPSARNTIDVIAEFIVTCFKFTHCENIPDGRDVIVAEIIT
jgi:hypothetical protein